MSLETRNAPTVNRGGSENTTKAGEPVVSIVPEQLHYPEVRQWNWNAAERDAYEFGYLLGHADGATAARDEIRKLNHEADRLYAEMCRRPAVQFVDPNRKSYKELQAIRAEIYGGAK